MRLVAVLVLVLAAAAEGRRHRYGNLNKARQAPAPRRAISSRMAYDDDLYEARRAAREAEDTAPPAEEEDSLEAIEDPTVDAIRAASARKKEVRPLFPLHFHAHAAPPPERRVRRRAPQWPPKWAQPVVVVGTIWYSSMFF